MSKPTIVTLVEPIEGHEGSIRQVEFREPRYRDIVGFGAPYSVHSVAGGEEVTIINEAELAHYIEACLVKPAEPDLLKQLGLRDTFAVRRAVLGFFLQPAAAGAGSKTSPETSGSAAAADPAKSAI